MIGKLKLYRGYNKWVTEGYSMYLKHKYLYGESYPKFKEFIKEIMGNVFKNLNF